MVLQIKSIKFEFQSMDFELKSINLEFQSMDLPPFPISKHDYCLTINDLEENKMYNYMIDGTSYYAGRYWKNETFYNYTQAKNITNAKFILTYPFNGEINNVKVSDEMKFQLIEN